MQQILRTTIRNIGTYSAMWVQVDYEHRRQNGVQQYSFNYRLWIGSRTDGSASSAQWGWAVSNYMYLDGTQFWSGNHAATSTKNWSQSWSTGWVNLAGKTSGTTQFKLYVTGGGDGVNYTKTIDIAVDPVLEAVKVSGTWKYGQLYVKDSGTWKQPGEKFFMRHDSWWQPVEYIQSSGTQYIDTEYPDYGDNAISCKFYTASPNSNYMFGGRQNSGAMLYNGFYSNKSIEYNYATVSFTANNNLEMAQSISGTTNTININGQVFTKSTGTGSNQNIFIFACNNSSVRYYTGNTRCYYFKIVRNGELVRDMIPVRNLFGTSCGMYDKVTDRIYINRGSGSFTCGPDIPYEEDLQPIEYIETTGTQYVDTGITPTKDTGWLVKMKVTAHGSSEWDIPFGSRATNAQSLISISTSALGCDYGAQTTSWGNPSITPSNVNTIEFYNDGDYMTRKLNGEQAGISAPKSTFYGTNPYTMLIGGFHNNSASFESRNTHTRWYSVKINDNGTPLLDFIPCRYKYNPSIVGMFDTINRKFYTNAGSGTFNKGDDLLEEYEIEELEYLESNGTQWIDTEYVNSNGCVVEGDIMFSSFKSGWDTIVGYQTTSGSQTAAAMLIARHNSNSNFTIRFGNQSVDSGFPIKIHQKQHVIVSDVIGNSYLTVDGSTKTSSDTYTRGTRSFYLFGNNDGGAFAHSSNSRIYNLQIRDGSSIVRDYVPAKSTVTGELGMYDKITKRFCTNKGTGTFIAGPKIEPITRFTEVSYIKTTGSGPYIETECNVGPSFGADIDFAFDNPSGDVKPFGTYGSYWGYAIGILNGHWRDIKNFSELGVNVPTGRINLTLNNSVTKINDTSINIPAPITSYHGFPLFAVNYQGTMSGNSVGITIYSCKLYNNGVLERDMMPCYRTSDETIGMYDKVTHVFYANNGTGSFTKGPDVN